MDTNKTKLSILATLALTAGVSLTREGNRLEFTETIFGFDHKEAFITSELAQNSKAFDTITDAFDGDSTDFTGIVDLSDEELGQFRNLVAVMDEAENITLLLERSDLEDLEPRGCFVDVPSDWEREHLGQLVEVSA